MTVLFANVIWMLVSGVTVFKIGGAVLGLTLLYFSLPLDDFIRPNGSDD